MGKRVKRALKTQSLKLNAASHNNDSWYTDTDGLLQYSPSGGSLYYKPVVLQKIILVFFGYPLVIMYWIMFVIFFDFVDN